MRSLFKRKKQESWNRTDPLMVTLYNPNLSDNTGLAVRLAEEYKKETGKKAVIVELPCIGIPRLAFRLPEKDIEEERSIEKYLLDLERNNLKAIDDYIVSEEHYDCLMLNPRAKADIPVLIKLSSTNTCLVAPIQLKRSLTAYYDLVILALQGQVFHPMTFTALRYADSVALTIDNLSEVSWNYGCYSILMSYGITEEQLTIYSELELQLAADICNSARGLLSSISQAPIKSFEDDDMGEKNYTKHVGIINPIEHVSYYSAEISQAELNQKDSSTLKALIDKTRQVLRSRHNDEFIEAIFDEGQREKVKHYIADFIREQNQYTFKISINKAIEFVQREITEMGVLQPLLDDPRITSIEINGPRDIIVERDGIPDMDTNVEFQDNEHIYNIITKMLTPMGKTLTANDPIIDSNYRGYRINVTLDRKRGGVSADHPIISIRKFPPDVFSDESCIAYGNFNEEMNDFFQDIYPIGAHVVFAGSVNSGKTSSLIRIPLYLSPETRLLTLEDSEEMLLKKKKAYEHYKGIASFIVKEHENESRRYGMAKLTKMAMRQNPKWVLIGEVRDHEAAIQALEAANTGSNFALTLHANSAELAAVRFMQLAGNSSIAASQVAATINFIIYQMNVRGRRVITEISEIISFENGGEKPIMNPIFKYNFVEGKHERVGNLVKFRDKMKDQGVPADVIERWCGKEEGA